MTIGTAAVSRSLQGGLSVKATTSRPDDKQLAESNPVRNDISIPFQHHMLAGPDPILLLHMGQWTYYHTINQ